MMRRKGGWIEFRESMENSAEFNATRAENIMTTDEIADGAGNYLSGAEKEAYAAKFSGREDAYSEVSSFITDIQFEIKKTNRTAVCPILLEKVEAWLKEQEEATATAKSANLPHSAIVVRHESELDTLKKIIKRIKKLLVVRK